METIIDEGLTGPITWPPLRPSAMHWQILDAAGHIQGFFLNSWIWRWRALGEGRGESKGFRFLLKWYCWDLNNINFYLQNLKVSRAFLRKYVPTLAENDKKEVFWLCVFFSALTRVFRVLGIKTYFFDNICEQRVSNPSSLLIFPLTVGFLKPSLMKSLITLYKCTQ